MSEPIKYSDKKVAELKQLCKDRYISGYSSKNKDDLIKLLEEYDKPVEESSTIDASLNKIKEVLENPQAQKELLYLYRISQGEYTFRGTTGSEIGISREKDLVAVLKYYLGNDIDVSIHNKLEEDFLMYTDKISVKHATLDKNKEIAIKAKWTADAKKAAEAITKFINKRNNINMLIVVFDMVNNQIIIHCIKYNIINELIAIHGKLAFNSSTGTNNRGIEYSKKIVDEFCKKSYFTITIPNANIKTDIIDPIQRRCDLLTKCRLDTLPESAPPS